MGKETGISWADHTFNCWWGCTRVNGSPACGPAEGEDGAACYAETWDARMGGKNWGASAPRRFFGDKHWSQLEQWNKAAEKVGERRRVFVMSMGDWAEGRPDQREHLERLWALVPRCSWLDLLLLTKRPQLIPALYPKEWQVNPLPNVWMGITAENRYWLENRWQLLKRIDAAVYWLSMEPLFESVILPEDFLALGSRAWVITGGQSGSKAVPSHPDWFRSIRDQCVSSGVPYHHKQNGEWAMVEAADGFGEELVQIGKKAAGHLLDGREWLQFPEVRR